MAGAGGMDFASLGQIGQQAQQAQQAMPFAGLGQIGQQAEDARQVPGLLQMAQDAMGNVMSGEQAFSSLPRIGTPEGDRSAWEYARYLELVDKLRANNPGFQLDTDRQNNLAIAGANYARGNNITYDPTSLDMGGGGGGGGGGFAGGDSGGASQRGNSGSGFRMGGKPITGMEQFQGDVGPQLNRISPAWRNALGPAVVQHILDRDYGAGSANRYPGSLSYMLGVPNTFEAGDSFRMNRDAWGRGFGLGSVDSMMLPMTSRPRP